MFEQDFCKVHKTRAKKATNTQNHPSILKQQKHKTMNHKIIIINILLISSSIFQSFGQGVGKARKMTFLREMSFLRKRKK